MTSSLSQVTLRCPSAERWGFVMESEVLGAAVAVAASWWQAAPPASSAPWGPPAPITTAWPSAPRFPRPHAHVPSALDSVSAVTSVTPELAAAPKADSSAASGAAPLLCGRHPHRLGDPPSPPLTPQPRPHRCRPSARTGRPSSSPPWGLCVPSTASSRCSRLSSFLPSSRPRNSPFSMDHVLRVHHPPLYALAAPTFSGL